MSKTLLSDLFETKINELRRTDQYLNTAYGKVKCRFIDFAASIKVSLDTLRMFHVCETSGGINKKFYDFLNKIKRKKKSKRPDSEFRREIRSIAERIILAIMGENTDEIKLSVAELNAPSWMEPILENLPRDFPRARSPKLKETGKHREYPLTLNSELLLEAMLKISTKYNLNAPQMLLVDYCSQLREDIRNTPRGKRPGSISRFLDLIRERLHFSTGKLVSKAFKFEFWPPKLKQQFEVYAKLATKEIGKTSMLGRLADFHKMKLGLVKEDTINRYKFALEQGLSRCQPLPENCGAEDLFELDERIIEIGGMEYSEKYNRYVDRYRQFEQDRFDESKRAGFDSVSFGFFRRALVNIGKYNGLFHLVEDFASTCTPQLDFETRKKKKTHKKKSATFKDIDKQIVLMAKDVDEIIDKKLFETNVNRSKEETEIALKKCLYLPILLILRFVGLRQINVRCATIMKNPENKEDPDGNIGIKKDGTLVFHFRAEETKNNKTIHIEFNKEEHGETHEVLIRGLTNYLKIVRLYIVDSGAENIGERCFVYIPKGQSKFKQFSASNEKNFYDIFTSWSKIFLESFLLAPERFGVILNPHFFRGTCCDWLLNVLGFTFEEIGLYIGDLAETVRKEYIDHTRVHDATNAVTTANIKINLLEKERESKDDRTESVADLNVQWQQMYIESQKRIKFLEDQLKEKDRQIEDLKGEQDAS